MVKIINKAFVAVYDRHDGEIGFLGIDTHSGGYAYFNDKPDDRYLRDDPAQAMCDANTIKDSMTNYSGSNEINFDTVRVVRYVISLEDVPNLEQEIHDELIRSAKSKLTDDELAALQSSLYDENDADMFGID